MIVDKHAEQPRRPQGSHWQRTHLPTHETRVPSLVQEDPLAEERAAHFRILAWEMPQTEEPGRL